MKKEHKPKGKAQFEANAEEPAAVEVTTEAVAEPVVEAEPAVEAEEPAAVPARRVVAKTNVKSGGRVWEKGTDLVAAGTSESMIRHFLEHGLAEEG